MTQVTENFDTRIQIVHPFLTKSLSDKDSNRLDATGTFAFSPQPQVDTTSSSIVEQEYQKEQSPQDRIEKIKEGLAKAVGDIDRIEEAVRQKAGHIVFRYDPELAENEALATAEEDVFGGASGVITYDMYVAILEFEEKVNKFISHMSVESDGAFSVPS